VNEYSLIRLILGVQVLWKLGISGRLVYYHTYFIVTSPQVGLAAGCAKTAPFAADYWIVQNGKAVANTGV
jgi:hypothetical protein